MLFVSKTGVPVASGEYVTVGVADSTSALFTYSGTSMIVSVENQCYNTQVREALSKAFAIISEPHEVAKPLDWTETHLPTRWQTFDGVKEFDWKY